MPQWKSLPTRSQSNFWLLFCSAHLLPSWFSLAQEGSGCFLANRSFLSTSHQTRASSVRQRYSVTWISDSEQQQNCGIVAGTCVVKATAGFDCLGDASWLRVSDLQEKKKKSVESHIGKSLFNLDFVKGRIVKCSFLCLLQLRQNMKIFNNKCFYIIPSYIFLY